MLDGRRSPFAALGLQLALAPKLKGGGPSRVYELTLISIVLVSTLNRTRW